MLRREFAITKPIKQARAYVTGLGYYELSINGKKIGDRRLEPGYTRYDKRVLYATHDVTDSLRAGQNALGMMLGNGWYNVQAQAAWDFDKAPWRASPRLLLELRIEYEDGSTETIVSDPNWKTAEGPVTYSIIYGGETYDARREQAGWDEPGFDDSKWDAAEVVAAPSGKLVGAGDASHQDRQDDRAHESHGTAAGRLRVRRGTEPGRECGAEDHRPRRH